MADINLLQTDSGFGPSAVNRTPYVIAKLLGVVLVLVVLLYGYLNFDVWQTNRNITKTKADIASAQSTALSNSGRNEVITRQGQVQQADKLLKGHMYWSYLLPELARVSLRSAKYTSVEADESGRLVLTASLPSYDDLEKFMQIFDLPEYNQQFSNVKILSITKSQEENSVETVVRLQLTFNPSYIKGRM